MKIKHYSFLSIFSLSIFLFSCKKEKTNDTTSEANLVLKFKFDPTQERLNNLGQPAPMAAGHAGQSPSFNGMSAHYVELAQTGTTALGKGAILYKAAETTTGGSNAIEFDKSTASGNNEVFFKTPLKDIAPGIYEWLRLSLAYQNYDVKYYVDTVIAGIAIKQEFNGTLASFIGFNTYIKNYKIKDQTLAVNANKKQGYWGFETTPSFNGISYPFTTTGQAPEGATTVVNPLFATSPVPAGSCVVTSDFPSGGLTITGKETSDIVVEVSLSTNKSFEWIEVVNDGKWAPSKGEQVVDMGIRGMKLKLL
ncbi:MULTISPECIES: hypothetical protein [Niastella]|uniref:Fimbrillin family protein n=1 Tax=Niastella soli TaxID=2821487 RepID=A0ABS3Z5V5_9BACT|nr:hypothetical protein [Niastella soli]MBO9205519.1 hypothetical protein [Niastella soli]